MKDPFYFVCLHCGQWSVEETEPKRCQGCMIHHASFRRFSTRAAAEDCARDIVLDHVAVDTSEGFR